MNLYKRWILALCLILTLLLAACGGGESTPEKTNDQEAETSEPTEVVEAEPTEVEEVEAEPTEVVEVEAEPTEVVEVEAEPTEVVEVEAEPTEADTEAEGPALGGLLDLSNAKVLDDVEDINSFRLRVNIQAQGDAFEGQDGAEALASGIDVQGAFIKDPVSQHIIMGLGEGLGTLEFLQVDNKSYAKFGEEWTEAPVEQAPQIEDLAFLTPADLAEGLEEFEQVGEETVNGRETVHLYADKEVFARLEAGDEELGIDQAEEVQLDLWFDKTEGFIVKMVIIAEGTGLSETDTEASGRIEMTLEYYDFNEEIVIEAPEI